MRYPRNMAMPEVRAGVALGGRKCVLVTTRSDFQETHALAEALGLKVVSVEVQRRDSPDPRTFIGKGKTTEVKDRAKELGADLIIVNGELKPSQVHGLQSATGLEVYDRVRLILEIFTSRAASPEARLQVELATLKHRVPFIKETISLSKRGEHPGLLAGGEVGTHQYLTEITRRMARIQRELDDVVRVREVRRKGRQRRSYVTVSIAGYTNAGKTSALNLLTEAGAEVDSRMFSTLSPLSRSVEGIEGRILINDTVGFIEDLPPWLIEAFNSTLEELYSSELVLLVLDIGEPADVLERKAMTSLEILKRAEETPPILSLLNKVDMVAPSELKAKVEGLQQRGLIVGPWLPVQLNVQRPNRRLAIREMLLRAILENLRTVALMDMVYDATANPFDITVAIDGAQVGLMDLVRERAIYLDLSNRSTGRVTFAVERKFLTKLIEIFENIPGQPLHLINHDKTSISDGKV
jgi:GTP-binding protein HflX